MRLYLDANIIIYLIEAVEPFQSRIRNHLFSFESQSASELVTSRLSCLECRSKPLAEKNSALLDRYDQFFSRSLLQLVEITPDVIERATIIRAHCGLSRQMRYILPAASYARLIHF
jgi:predicted nucleic acid-binding protein